MKVVSPSLQVIPNSITGCLYVLVQHHGSFIISQSVVCSIACEACEHSYCFVVYLSHHQHASCHALASHCDDMLAQVKFDTIFLSNHDFVHRCQRIHIYRKAKWSTPSVIIVAACLQKATCSASNLLKSLPGFRLLDARFYVAISIT